MSFRTYLKPSSEPMEGPSLDFFSRLIDPRYKLSAADIDAAAASENEMLRYAVASRVDTLSAQDIRLAFTNFLQVCLSDADQEGVVWTPLLDCLAVRKQWSFALQYGGRSLPPHLKDMPHPWARAQGLVPWVKAQDDLTLVLPLLEFRSSEVHEILAKHGRAFDQLQAHQGDLSPAQMAALLEQAKALGENFDIPLPALSRMAKEEIGRWEHAPRVAPGQSGRERRKEMQRSIQVLLTAAQRGALTPEMRERIFALKDQTSHASATIEILLADADCERALLRRIARLAPGKASEQGLTTDIGWLYIHPNATDADRRALSRSQMGLQAALRLVEYRSPPVEAAGLLTIQSLFEGEVALAERLATHPNADEAVLTRIARSHRTKDVQLGLATNTRARAIPEVRELLSQARSKFVVGGLLQDAPAGEYPGILARLVEMDLSHAIRTFLACPPPPGCDVPADVAARMLASGKQDERLAVLRHLGRSRSAGDAPAPPAPRR